MDSKIRKDNKLNRLVNSRKSYFILLALVIVYLFLDDRILNEPFSFILTRWAIAAVTIFSFCLFRFKKFKEYYTRKIKDRLFLLFTAVLILLSIIFLQAFLSIPFNYIVKLYSQNNQIEYQKCPIKNVVTTGVDKVHFMFLNRTYTRHFETVNHSREDLINNYNLKIGIRKSIANSYYLESIEVEEK